MGHSRTPPPVLHPEAVRYGAAIKTLTRALIAAVGGLEAATACCRVGRSRLAEYQDRHGEHFMPLDVVLALELVAGEPIVTAALLREQGWSVERPAPASGAGVADGVADLARGAGEIAATFVASVADGRIDPAERATLRGLADRISDAADTVRAALGEGAA